MTEQEVSVRLTENDERLYACAKRLEAVEPRQDALAKLVTGEPLHARRQELYTTYEGFALARLAVGYGYLGTLPWVAATVSAAWGAYGASAGFYYNKAKAENTTGGIVFEAACGRQARRGPDCDGWEENG